MNTVARLELITIPLVEDNSWRLAKKSSSDSMINILNGNSDIVLCDSMSESKVLSDSTIIIWSCMSE